MSGRATIVVFIAVSLVSVGFVVLTEKSGRSRTDHCNGPGDFSAQISASSFFRAYALRMRSN
jgi:hypothetical protein